MYENANLHASSVALKTGRNHQLTLLTAKACSKNHNIWKYFFIAVIRQQFVLLRFSIPELVGANQRFSTDPEVLQNCGVSLCAVQQVQQSANVLPQWVWHHACCVQIYCVLCLIIYLLNSQLWLSPKHYFYALMHMDWISALYVCWVLLRIWLPKTISLHRLLKSSTQK